MNILGIETSCDETSASIVRDGCMLLSNVTATSLKEHQKFGGIIPEIASRRQLDYINIVTTQALKSAGISLKDIDAVAYTQSPGLIGSLLVGITFAHALSFALRKPLVPVNHIHAHLYANYVVNAGNIKEARQVYKDLRLPAVGLVVSGGHSSLFLIRSFTDYRVIGQTRDDAAGEAYDKVARIMGLGYPGGPAIDKLARVSNDGGIKFPRAALPGTNDFSFSGVKTAVLYYIQKNASSPGYSTGCVARAFQDSVVDVLVEKSIAVCHAKKAKTLLIGGGVSANASLRERLTLRCAEEGIKAHFPSMPLCMDNAAMVAGLGYHEFKAMRQNNRARG